MEASGLDVEVLVQSACESVAKLNSVTLWRRFKELRFFEDYEAFTEASSCEVCGGAILGVEALAKHYFRCGRGHSEVAKVDCRVYDVASTIFCFLALDELGRSVLDSSKDVVCNKILTYFVKLSYPVVALFVQVAQEYENLQHKKSLFGRTPFKRKRISPSRICHSPSFRDSESRNCDDNSELESTSDDEYRVDAILDTRRAKDRKTGKTVKQYLVKWAGYGEENATWEPWMNLWKCRRLVKEFEDKQKKNKRTSHAKKTKTSRPANETPTASASANDSAVGNKRDFLDELVRVTLNQGASADVKTTSSALPSSNNEPSGSQEECKSSSPITAALESLNQEYDTTTLINSDMNVILENYSGMDYSQIDYSEIQFDESGNCFYEHFSVAPNQEDCEESMAELNLACSNDASYPSMPLLDEIVMEPQPTENPSLQDEPPAIDIGESISREETSANSSENQVGCSTSSKTGDLQESMPDASLVLASSGQAETASDGASHTSSEARHELDTVINVRTEEGVPGSNDGENQVSRLSSSDANLEESVLRNGSSSTGVVLVNGNEENTPEGVPEASKSSAEGTEPVTGVSEESESSTQECRHADGVSHGKEKQVEEERATRYDDEHRQESVVGVGNEGGNEDSVVELRDDAVNTEDSGKTGSPVLAEGGGEGATLAGGSDNDSGVELAEVENSVGACKHGVQEATYGIALSCEVLLGKFTEGREALVTDPVEIQPEATPSTADYGRAEANSPAVSIHGIECEVESQALDLAVNKNPGAHEETVLSLEENCPKSACNVGEAVRVVTGEWCQSDAEPFNLGETHGSTLVEDAADLKAVEVVQNETEPLNMVIAGQCNYSAAAQEPNASAVVDRIVDVSCDSGYGGSSHFVVTNASASDNEHDVRPESEEFPRNPAYLHNLEKCSSLGYNRGQNFFSLGATMQPAIERNHMKRRRTMCAEETPRGSSENGEKHHLVSRQLEETVAQIRDILHDFPVTLESMSGCSPRAELEMLPDFESSQERPIGERISLRKTRVVLEKLSSTVLESIIANGSWKVSTSPDVTTKQKSVDTQERLVERRVTHEDPKKVSAKTVGGDLRSTAKAVSMAVSFATRSKIYVFHGSSDEEEEDERLECRPQERRVSRYGRRLKLRRMSPYEFLDQ